MTASRRYLRALRNAVPRSVRRRVVAEIRNHLAEAIAAERARGLDRGEAERLTIERLGPPEHLAAQFSADTSRPAARFAARTSRRTVTIVAGLAALAVVAAVAGLAVVHTQHPPASPARRAADKVTLRSGIVALSASPATPLQVAVGRRMTPEAQSIRTIVLQLGRIVRHRIVLTGPRGGRSVTLPSR